MDEDTGLSFILDSDRGFLSDLQKINFSLVTKVASHFAACGCGGGCFSGVSEAQVGGAVPVLINREICLGGLKSLGKSARRGSVSTGCFCGHAFAVRYCLRKVSYVW